MPSGKLTIDYLPLASLHLDPKNARLHSDKQVRQIAKSIEVFGFNVPILVDADLRVVAGHGRLLAGRLLGIADVPVIRLEHLSHNQRRAFMLADNKLTENSEWDKRILAEQLTTLSLADLDFSVAVTGFEVGEIDVMIENLAPVGRSKNDPSDVLPDLGTKPHVSRVGDLWILDRHRVYCGDARSENSYTALIKDCRAHMAFTDPRYNNPADGHLKGPSGDHQPQFTATSGEIPQSEFFTFLTTVLAEMVRNSRTRSFRSNRN
jgi:hypothetical protein